MKYSHRPVFFVYNLQYHNLIHFFAPADIKKSIFFVLFDNIFLHLQYLKHTNNLIITEYLKTTQTKENNQKYKNKFKNFTNTFFIN